MILVTLRTLAILLLNLPERVPRTLVFSLVGVNLDVFTERMAGLALVTVLDSLARIVVAGLGLLIQDVCSEQLNGLLLGGKIVRDDLIFDLGTAKDLLSSWTLSTLFL